MLIEGVSDAIVILLASLLCVTLCLCVLGILWSYKNQKKRANHLKELRERTEEIHKVSATESTINTITSQDSTIPRAGGSDSSEQEMSFANITPKYSPRKLPSGSANLYVQSQKELQDLALAIDTLTSVPETSSVPEQTLSVFGAEQPRLARSTTALLVQSMMADLKKEENKQDAVS